MKGFESVLYMFFGFLGFVVYCDGNMRFICFMSFYFNLEVFVCIYFFRFMRRFKIDFG